MDDIKVGDGDYDYDSFKGDHDKNGIDLSVTPLRSAAENLYENDEKDGAHGPDCDTLHDGNCLLAVRVLQVLVVAEEASVEGLEGVGEDIDVGHGQEEDKEADDLQGALRKDIPAAGVFLHDHPDSQQFLVHYLK